MSKKGYFRGNAKLNIKKYDGWVPRPMRKSVPDPKGQERGAVSRRTKSTRVFGNVNNRNLYISAHAYKSRQYGELCRMADKVN